MPVTMQVVTLDKDKIYDLMPRSPSPGHDSEVEEYLGSPRIIHLDALRVTEVPTTPPRQATLGRLPSPTSSQEWQVCNNPSKFPSTKTLVKVMFVTD